MVNVPLAPVKPPRVEAWRFPSGASFPVTPGQDPINVSIDKATAEIVGDRWIWNLPRGRGLGLMSARFNELNNGRIALNKRTRVVTQISRTGHIWTGTL